MCFIYQEVGGNVFSPSAVWAQGGTAVLFSFKMPEATGHFLNGQKYPAVLGYS